jgi:hypothetical protein
MEESRQFKLVPVFYILKAKMIESLLADGIFSLCHSLASPPPPLPLYTAPAGITKFSAKKSHITFFHFEFR